MITSFRNPLVKRIKKLQRKKYRQEQGAFFIEGIRVVLAALEQGAPLEALVYAPDLLTSDAALAAVAAQEVAGAPVRTVAADVFASFSTRQNPVGLAAIVSARLHELETLRIDPNSVFVALHQVSDPGNLGTIVRTLDAVGAAGLVLVGASVDPFHPTAVKASMGTLFSLPVAAVPDMAAVWPWAHDNGLQTIATSAHAASSFWNAPYRLPALLLLGSEGEGLPSADLSRADLAVSIPMFGTASSLNLSVAAGLLLYELRRP